ncbi:Unconventional myosin [Seminavis robusta]|uniref:Unconventional myosin n=1 Tax=Seminavis robusta TaxID=568900 RepID=A0A9N8HQV8_9STRA|nr:Unconventional myosin [Seminavis robusta]|eukprot:Sro1241_g255450.1 Unconventional myosin (1090) ;mRNA; r:24343-27715
MGKQSFVYVRSKEYAWVPAIQTDTDGKKATVQIPAFKDEQSIDSDGCRGKKTEEKVDLKGYVGNVLPLQNVDGQGMLIEIPDMVELPYLHEAGILYNLKRRHRDGKPYTRTGDIVIAINPFQWFTEIYTDAVRTRYSNKLVWTDSGETDPRTFVDPHVYETSSLCYKGLAFYQTDQSILVSGESGAGKTETVKIAMNHMASVQRGPVEASSNPEEKFEDPVVNRVLQSNPLLETFGNAKTTRNDNSSRFGKYTQLQFDCLEIVPGNIDRTKSRCHLGGSKCEAYLLEKNRVTGHTEPERTYHVFYQILAAPDDQKASFWSGLKGSTFDSFKYVGATSTTKIEKRTDAEWFEGTCETLSLINLGGDKLIALMRAITAVLQCGNLAFGALGGDADKSECTSKDVLAGLSDILGVAEPELNLAFTERTMKTRNETYKVPLNAETAKNSCDAFAKEVYGKLFLWLVEGINEATKAENNYSRADGQDPGEFGIIGLLDIFGFESFVINRFEQLCINYANEKLQQKFTEDIFRSVQLEYEAEGIELAEITFDDNTDVLDLIEGRTGLCAMLNEECVRPKGSDEAFVQKALGANKKSPCLLVNNMDRMGFGIHHYAGKVMYSAQFFVERNQDTLPTDLEDAMMKSSNFIVAHKPAPAADAGKAPKRQKSNIVGSTIWAKYKTQLASLMGSLRKTQSRYIRCLKPNKAKVPVKMEHIGTVEQLRCAGVVAAVTISRSAFPNKLPNDTVRLRFSGFWDKAAYPAASSDLKDECFAMMTCALKEKAEGDKVAFAVGKTKTYFRSGALEYLEANRAAGLEVHCIPIQKITRGYVVRKKFAKMLNSAKEAERLAKEKAEAEARALADKAAAEKAARDAEFQKEIDKVASAGSEYTDKGKKSDEDTEAKIKECEERVVAAEKESAVLKEKTGEDAKALIMEPKKQKAAAETKLAANLKQVEVLRKENKKIKKEHDKIKKKYDEIKKNNKKLLKANEASGGSFEGENDDMMKVHEKNEKLLDDLEGAKDKNRDMKEACQDKQAEYMNTAESRLEFQKTMARILNLIQDNCKDRQLIEDTSAVAHGCESESKAIMAALEAEYGD